MQETRVWSLAQTSLVTQKAKNPPAMLDGDLGSISGWGRSPGEGHGNPLQYFLLGESPRTEEPGGLQCMGSPRVGHDWATKHTRQEDPTCRRTTKRVCHSCWDCALEPGIQNYWRPLILEPVFCNKRSHCNEKPMHCNWRVTPAHN